MPLSRVPSHVLHAAICIVVLAFAVGCHHANLQQSLQTVTSQPHQPVLLAVYEAWFGDHDHINVGYSSNDRSVLEKQVTQAQDLGISAFVVDWYGPRKASIDRNYALLQQVAKEKGFRVALMYDEPQNNHDQSTEAAISSLQYAYENYVGPNAADREAYLHYQGRPVVFVWPRSSQTDWKRVRQSLASWQPAPILINEDGTQTKGYVDEFDGFYAWVKPGKSGWERNGKNWGEDYLESFYKRMTTHYPDKIMVGAVWPGFNDARASWSENRFMDARCGKTFNDSVRLFDRYHNESRPVPFLLIVTWNDYEEGTAIERGLPCS